MNFQKSRGRDESLETFFENDRESLKRTRTRSRLGDSFYDTLSILDQTWETVETRPSIYCGAPGGRLLRRFARRTPGARTPRPELCALLSYKASLRGGSTCALCRSPLSREQTWSGGKPARLGTQRGGGARFRVCTQEACVSLSRERVRAPPLLAALSLRAVSLRAGFWKTARR